MVNSNWLKFKENILDTLLLSISIAWYKNWNEDKNPCYRFVYRRVPRLIDRIPRKRRIAVNNTNDPPQPRRMTATVVLGLFHWATDGFLVSYQHEYDEPTYINKKNLFISDLVFKDSSDTYGHGRITNSHTIIIMDVSYAIFEVHWRKLEKF